MANQGKKGSTIRMTLSRWALLLELVMGGCAPAPLTAVLEPRMSEDRCKAGGGVLVGTMCYQDLENPSAEWSARKVRW